MQNDTFSTPMMKQYLELKNAHADCLLLFRLGDFYEMFLDDAKIGSEVLDITLTSRDRGSDGRIPMAGIPYHALDSYLHKLIKVGFKVAICEQVGDLNADTKLITREVVRIVTPGTTLDSKTLEKKENNYIVSISHNGKLFGISAADISTGDFYAAEHTITNLEHLLKHELQKFNPVECILCGDLYEDPAFLKLLTTFKKLNIYKFSNWNSYAANEKYAADFLKHHFGVSSLRTFSIHDLPHAIISSAALLGYLKDTQKTDLKHIKKIKNYAEENTVVLDASTIFNLELFTTIREKESSGSLINILDKTSTAMGGRLLRQWLKNPLRNQNAIANRLDTVDFFNTERFLRDELREILNELLDIERLVSRLSVGIGNARDLVNLKLSLQKIMVVKEKIAGNSLPLLNDIETAISDELKKLIEFIDFQIVDEPPIDTKIGGMIKERVSADLDDLKKTISKSNSWITTFETAERARTGIASLKVKFNKVFGFYIEISKSNLASVPDDYFRKQTMVNAERYITEELKYHEQIVLSAEEKINKLEYELFVQTVETLLENVDLLQAASKNIATLDCLLSFSFISQANSYCRPQLNTSGLLEINEGRHPVVEQFLDNGLFVPNDTLLNSSDSQLHIITGPNMAGKSVYIRQVALIVLMAHLGCFVPAKKANISIVDRIFVRSGASDVITQGLSTFMIEMIEAGYILNHATSDSLIVMDELGRGTSTYDGISIASAIAQYIATNIKAKTLFATHYHELQDLENHYPQIKNYQVAVKHTDGNPVFLHKVILGGASHSFGINVAEMAGLPREVLEKAAYVLRTLETEKELT